MINRLFLLTVFTASLTARSVAATDLQLDQSYSTGYQGSTQLFPGQPDPYFTLYSGGIFGVTTPVVAYPIPVAYGPVPAGSQWIAPTENQTDNPPAPIAGDPPGLYGYNENLSTNFLVPTSVTFTGSFEADNSVQLYINNQFVTAVSSAAFATPTTFNFTLTLGPGQLSTPIDFYVFNIPDGNTFAGVSANPTGLLVSGLKATASAVPEPGTWLMLFAGVGALFLVPRVRRAIAL